MTACRTDERCFILVAPVFSADAEPLRSQRPLANAGCTPLRSQQSAATSQGTFGERAPDLATVAPQVIAPVKNKAALTCSSRANPVSVKLPAEIKPIPATEINADNRDTALLMAD